MVATTFALLAATLAVPAGWYAASPHYTLHAMQQAALAGDADALEARVDFPALRQSLKDELQAQLAREAVAAGPLARFGVELAQSFVGPMIDSSVTAETLRLVLDGSAGFQPPRGLATLALLAVPSPAISRDGLDRFTVGRNTADTPAFVFRRDGLGWKLAGVRFPQPDAASI